MDERPALQIKTIAAEMAADFAAPGAKERSARLVDLHAQWGREEPNEAFAYLEMLAQGIHAHSELATLCFGAAFSGIGQERSWPNRFMRFAQDIEQTGWIKVEAAFECDTGGMLGDWQSMGAFSLPAAEALSRFARLADDDWTHACSECDGEDEAEGLIPGFMERAAMNLRLSLADDPPSLRAMAQAASAWADKDQMQRDIPMPGASSGKARL